MELWAAYSVALQDPQLEDMSLNFKLNHLSPFSEHRDMYSTMALMLY